MRAASATVARETRGRRWARRIPENRPFGEGPKERFLWGRRLERRLVRAPGLRCDRVRHDAGGHGCVVRLRQVREGRWREGPGTEHRRMRYPRTRRRRLEHQRAAQEQSERNENVDVAGIPVEVQNRGRREGRIPCRLLFLRRDRRAVARRRKYE